MINLFNLNLNLYLAFECSYKWSRSDVRLHVWLKNTFSFQKDWNENDNIFKKRRNVTVVVWRFEWNKMRIILKVHRGDIYSETVIC